MGGERADEEPTDDDRRDSRARLDADDETSGGDETPEETRSDRPDDGNSSDRTAGEGPTEDGSPGDGEDDRAVVEDGAGVDAEVSADESGEEGGSDEDESESDEGEPDEDAASGEVAGSDGEVEPSEEGGSDVEDAESSESEEGESDEGAESTEDADVGDGERDRDDGGPVEIEDVDGVGASRAVALRDAGFETVDDLRNASREELTDVAGIGDALAARIEADLEGSGTSLAATTEPEDADATGERVAVEDADERGEPLLSGPQSDQEMPLTAHIEEMVKRLAIVVAIAGVVSLVTFPFAEYIINFLWYNIMPGVPGDVARPRLYGVLELVFTKLKVASLAGLLVALPALVYETYQFMRPGLYPHERRYYLAAVPASLVLALVGVSFAYFVVLPAIFTYFLAYSQDVATIGFALGRTFDLILVLMGYLALVFQIPLFIMLAMMMGLVTRRWLAARRLLFWGAFLGVSFIFSPDPTGMAPVIIALTMVGLFEGTLLLTKWAGRE